MECKFSALPGSTAYHAAKWAVGGFTESLAQEVSPLGVKVCALEPGGMRTNWGARAHKDTPDLLPDYEPSVGAVVQALHSLWGQENSDPARVAQVIIRLAASNRLPAHLLLGSDAVTYAGEAEVARAADADRWREISVSTDVNAPGSLPALRFGADPRSERELHGATLRAVNANCVFQTILGTAQSSNPGYQMIFRAS